MESDQTGKYLSQFGIGIRALFQGNRIELKDVKHVEHVEHV